MAEQDTPPDSPLSPQEVEEEGDGEPAPPAAPGTAVVPLTKDAIEKFLSCQLDTHLNDATPRDNERGREHRQEEAWQQPPALQHHDSKSNRRSQTKGGKSEREQGAQRPDVPGTVEQPMDDDTRAKLEKQRLELLERKLAEQEKQTKMLYERLGRNNSMPPAGANGHGPPAHAAGAGVRRGGTNRKDRFEQLLLESASRAKEKTEQRKTQAKDGHDGDAPTLHRQMSHSTSYRKDGADKGARSTRSVRSSDNASHGGASPRHRPESVTAEGYSNSAAVDSIEHAPPDKEAGGKKRGKSKRELISVEEQTAEAVGRTKSGTEIDLETGLPREETKSGFSWFYAICFVVLVVILVYASVIILQRYT